MSKAVNPIEPQLSFNDWQQYLYRVRQRNYLRRLGRPIPDHLKEENDLINIEDWLTTAPSTSNETNP